MKSKTRSRGTRKSSNSGKSKSGKMGRTKSTKKGSKSKSNSGRNKEKDENRSKEDSKVLRFKDAILAAATEDEDDDNESAVLAKNVVVLRKKDGRALRTLEIESPKGVEGGLGLIDFQARSDLFLDVHEVSKYDDILSMIRESARKQSNHLTGPDAIAMIKGVCETVQEIFAKENRLLEISEPAYIFGDLHGHIKDLIWFSDNFWPLGPRLATANFLFLGDYVDRVKWGLHVTLYLFCMKIAAPSSFFLLRGNHEDRDVQLSYTFYDECIKFYGKEDGEAIWESVNNAFDRLPLCAIVDDKVFCCHGGIPAHTTLKKDILKIPCPLPKPEHENEIAWGLMWNDPAPEKYFKKMSSKKADEMKVLGLDAEYFLPNTDRNTGHFFSPKATQRFLAAINGPSRPALTAVIRAHEEASPGFEFRHGGGVITIFSAADYQGAENNAAIILIKKGVIRPIQVELN